MWLGNQIGKEFKMTRDYEFYSQNIGKTEVIVQQMFSSYKGLIYKRAINYTKNFNGKFDVEDFVSDVYLKLFYYANWFNPTKLKPETFMFHLHVNNAINDVLTKLVKTYSKESYSLDEDERGNSSSIEEDATNDICYEAFLSKLTPLQAEIFLLKKEGKTTVAIQEILNISYFITSENLKKMKAIYLEAYGQN